MFGDLFLLLLLAAVFIYTFWDDVPIQINSKSKAPARLQ